MADDNKKDDKTTTETKKLVVGEEKDAKAKSAAEGQASGDAVTRTDVVDVEDGDEVVENVSESTENGPEGGRAGLAPNYGAPREDGLIGVDPDYPAQASRSGGDDDSDD